MGIVFISHNIGLLSVKFDEITENCNYTFSIDGETAIFTARISVIRNIKRIEYSEEPDKFIILITPLQLKVSRISRGVTWDCICGKEVGFPMKLVDK